ncbi:MAG: hypothetical protein ACXWJD_09250 [Burkholderiaceae bacterium]
MKSTLTIKDLALDKVLDGKTMSAVHGGNSDQANATQQGNFAQMKAPVSVGNDAGIYGPVNFQVDSNPTQTLSNYSTSTNDKSFGLYDVYAL